MPEPFSLLQEEWIEPVNERGEPTFESWEALAAYTEVEELIEYDYRNARMLPDPETFWLAVEADRERDGGESPFRTDRGVAMALLRSSNVTFLNR